MDTVFGDITWSVARDEKCVLSASWAKMLVRAYIMQWTNLPEGVRLWFELVVGTTERKMGLCEQLCVAVGVYPKLGPHASGS